MRAFLAGARIQLRFLRAYSTLIPFFTAPCQDDLPDDLQARQGGRHSPRTAAIAPVFIALCVARALQTRAGRSRRNAGTAPSSARRPHRRRLLLNVSAGSRRRPWSASSPSSRHGCRARLIFGTKVTIHPSGLRRDRRRHARGDGGHRGARCRASSCSHRNATTFSNSASYPFYVLGGILVPVSVLPHWIQPLSSIVFLVLERRPLRAQPCRPTPMHDFALRLGWLRPRSRRLAIGAWSMRVILLRVRD